MTIHLSLKGSDQITQEWSGAERDFLIAGTVLFGKAGRRTHEWQ
jgi:hypothetical protein